MVRKRKIFSVVVTIMLAFTTICFSGCSKEDVGAFLNNDLGYFQQKDYGEMYYKKTKECLEKDMQCPSTAVYPDISKIRITADTMSPRVSINSYYDAENLMGAMVRVYYTIIFDYDENGNEIYSITYH